MKQSINLFEILAQRNVKKRRYFDDYLEYARTIKEKALKLLGNARVFVFGSIIKKEWLPTSDIDILVISENVPKNSFEQTKIKFELIKDFKENPFQIHLVSPQEYESWYKNFIKGDLIEIN